MSFEAVGWAIRQTPSTATEKLVLISIAEHHNRSTGRCDPSYATIARDAMCSRRTAMRAVQSLEQQGLIIVERRVRRSCYFVLPDGVVTKCHHPGDTGDTTLVSPVSPEQGSEQGSETRRTRGAPVDKSEKPRRLSNSFIRDHALPGEEWDDAQRRLMRQVRDLTARKQTH